MRGTLSFVLFLSFQVWNCFASGYFYKGLALTSIDVVETGRTSEGEEKNPLVQFDGTIAGKADDKDSTFIKNIKEVKNKDGNKVLEAEKLTVKQAKKIINEGCEDRHGKPLFCLHGFNVQPSGHLKTVKNAQDLFNKGKFMLVPVMWPSEGGVKNYGNDRETTPGAGNGLKSLKDKIDCFPSKSLLAHSMGNRVLRYAADAKFKFDNIFMVAADVQHDIFNEDYINSGNKSDPNRRELQGLTICKMLNRGGKVYALVNGADFALVANRFNPGLKLEWRKHSPRASALRRCGAHLITTWSSQDSATVMSTLMRLS